MFHARVTSAKQSVPWIKGVRVQLRVISALMMKEAIGHHGHENLGFFWVVAEPLLLMSGIMILWTLAHISHNSEVDVIPFALTGYSYITLWRHISSQSVRIMNKNRMLRYHRTIQMLDTIFAKAALETIAIFTAFMVAYIPLSLLGLCPVISDPLTLVGGFIFTGWFAFGVGLTLAGLSEVSEIVKHVVGTVMYITLPLTGAFTMQAWLPEHLSNILAWSPLVNCVEMIRSGLFPASVPTEWSAPYLFATCSLTTIVGLYVFHKAESFLED